MTTMSDALVDLKLEKLLGDEETEPRTLKTGPPPNRDRTRNSNTAITTTIQPSSYIGP